VPGRTDEGAAAGQDRDLGPLLRDWRRAAGLTQEELADRSGLSVRAISDLERGRSTRPHRRSVALIADALGLSSWTTPPARPRLEAEYQVLLAVIDLAAASRASQHAWQLPWAIETFFFRRGHWHDFLAVQRAAVAAALRLADVLGQAHAYHGLGRACAMTGARAEAAEHLSQALRLYQELGTLTGEARCEIDMALAVARQGSYRAALGHAEQAGRLCRAAGHLAGQAGALNNTGWYQIQLGDYELAGATASRP
jgi:transcriptional regulator with XRE-family HTH domain